MRATHRLTPLALCIGLSLSAHAFAQDASQQMEDLPDDFTLCPIVDAVPPFQDVPAEGIHLGNADRSAHPTDIEGDTLSGTDVAPQFEGNVALRRGDQFLGADKLTYDSEHQRYVAEGDIRYQDNAMRLTAERAEGNQAADEHRIEDLKYQLVSRRGNGESDVIELHGAQGVLRGSTYSTCDPTDRHWELRARRIDVDSAKGFATAHSAVLRVGKVPVLYVPWFMFPIDERRHTGLLFPSLSNSDRNGFDYKQPIYLNLAPNYDATLYPRIMTERGALLGVEGRYLGRRGQATLSGAYINNDDLRPEYGARGHGAFNGFYNVSRNWQARANLLHISDPRYFEDFNSSINGIAVYNAHSAAGLFGRGRNWVSSLSIDRYQLADYTLTERSLPYDRLPRAYLSWDWRDLGWLEGGVDAEAVYFQKGDVVPVVRPGQPTTFDSSGGARLDIKPYLSVPLSGAAWFLRPTLAWRYTAYQLDRDFADFARVPRTPTRSLPIASVDAGLFFDRATTLDGESYLQTLEPRLYYLRAPYRDQSQLPVFDTGALTFSWGQMFRDNRFSGGDRQSDANQLTLALTSRLLRESDGKERLALSLGQIRYFDDSLVTLPRQQPIEQGRSAWVADASWAPSDRWTVGASYQWNPTEREKDLLSVRGRYLLPDDGVVNLSYRFRRDVSEQTDFSFLYPINKTWSVVGRHYWSIMDAKPLEQILGFQWDSCCVAVRLVARRYVQNREGDLSRGLMLEIELKGLGSAGQDTRKTLRRAILGYNRGDLYLVPPQTATAQPPDDPDNQP